MSKKYFWLKLKKDFFFFFAIKKLRSIAGGDTYTIILLKMYLLSLDKGGKIEFEGVEDTFAEELALELDEDASNVEIVLQYMEKRKLLEILSEKEFFMPYVLENTGSESESAERVRKLRERNRQKTLQCNGDVTGSNDNVRTCNTEIEIEKELDIDTEKEKIESSNELPCEQSSPASTSDRALYQEVVNLYNQYCTSFPRIKSLSEARKKAIKARMNSGYNLKDFEKLFELAEKSSFLKGKNDRDWRATFDWLIKDSNMAKVLDGNYSDRPGKKNGNNNSFFNFEQRDTDYDALVRDYYTQAF